MKQPVGANPRPQDLPLGPGGVYLGSYVCDPLDRFDLTDFVKIMGIFDRNDLIAIMKALVLRLSPQKFAELPEDVRNHFCHHGRDKVITRYRRSQRVQDMMTA